MKLPVVGLGTWELRGEECSRVVKQALELGYRHIDTAHVYKNHSAVKEGILGFDRKELYLTSKIAVDEQVDQKHLEKSVIGACEKALKELGTEYLDLYLIHWPHREFPLDEIFQTMERLQRDGKVMNIGVSNYNMNHLEDLRKAGGNPFANQVEFHPYLHQKELLAYCKKHHIKLISYRSFGKGKLVNEELLFREIGAKYGKTGAQVILRWLVQQDIAVIPKASSKEHLAENLAIFDFSLSPEEMAQIDLLHKNKRYCAENNPEYDY